MYAVLTQSIKGGQGKGWMASFIGLLLQYPLQRLPGDDGFSRYFDLARLHQDYLPFFTHPADGAGRSRKFEAVSRPLDGSV